MLKTLIRLTQSEIVSLETELQEELEIQVQEEEQTEKLVLDLEDLAQKSDVSGIYTRVFLKKQLLELLFTNCTVEYRMELENGISS
jgi:DNA repair exonuclease SbcCD nuclease subunit